MSESVNIRSGLVLLGFAFTAQAADLKRETLSAWEVYVGSATAETQERVRSNRPFLKLDEDQDSLSKVRNGEIIVLHNGSEGLKMFHRVSFMIGLAPHSSRTRR